MDDERRVTMTNGGWRMANSEQRMNRLLIESF